MTGNRHKRQRPATASSVADRMKVHQRTLRLDRRDYTVVTLRPGTRARFATNRYHETWHILSDQHGARLLGRLLWGLSFQRRPGTLVLIDRPQLDSNPFDAETSDPIAIIPTRLTHLPHSAAHALRRQLPLRGRPDGTARWHSAGLDAAVADERAESERMWSGEHRIWQPRPDTHGARVERPGRLLVLAARATLLREWAVSTSRLGDYWYDGMDYVDLETPDDQHQCHANGEVQIFRDFRQRVAAARVARQEILATLPTPPPAEDLNPLIWHHSTSVRARHVRSAG